MEKKFKARDGSRLKDEQANAYGHRMLELMEEKGVKLLKAEDLVEDARENPDVVYHDYFQWDDEEAGKAYRLKQAGELFRLIVEIEVVVLDARPREIDVRSFFNVKEGGNRGWAEKKVVFDDEDMRAQVLAKALSEAESWSRRYLTYIELASIRNEIETILKRHRFNAQKKVA